MKYLIINTDDQTITMHDCQDFKEAVAAAKLPEDELDHGNISRYCAFFVYGLGLVKPIQSTYCAVGGQLLNGNVLLYWVDEFGETVDFPEHFAKHLKLTVGQHNHIIFYRNIAEVEAAIRSGELVRPATSINGEILSEWRNGTFGKPLYNLVADKLKGLLH